MEGAALADSREYQDRLARGKGLPATAMGDGTLSEQQLCRLVQQARERARQLEQEKQQLQQQLLQQAMVHRKQEQQLQQLQEQVSQTLNTTYI